MTSEGLASSVPVFRRELHETHEVGVEWPTFVGQVELGNVLAVETVEVGPNGPIEVAGIRAGDVLAVHILDIRLQGPFFAPNGGPFFEGLGPPVPLELVGDRFVWPDGLSTLQARPSVGNVAVLPEPTEGVLSVCRELWAGPEAGKPNPRGWRAAVREVRGKHCHQDCWAVGAGSIVHLVAQVDGAGLCLGDVHGYIGQGELAFAAIECDATVTVRVERSEGWLVDWPLVETDREVLVICSYARTPAMPTSMRYVDLVREAYRAMREVVAARLGVSISKANSIVATAMDLRNCALYGLGEGYIPQHRDMPPWELAVAGVMPKAVLST